jgi:hypothetical protein
LPRAVPAAAVNAVLVPGQVVSIRGGKGAVDTLLRGGVLSVAAADYRGGLGAADAGAADDGAADAEAAAVAVAARAVDTAAVQVLLHHVRIEECLGLGPGEHK